MADHGGFDPSELFVHRGKGGIPGNVKRVVRRAEVDRSVKFIPNLLFRNCRQLESVLLREGLLWIGEIAFQGCSSLRSIRCPSTVTEIGRGAFSRCSNLATVKLPDGLESIEDLTFWECTSLEEVQIPASVDWIGVGAFEDCMNLMSIQLREGLRMIGGRAFNGCQSLESLRVPSSVDEVGGLAFDGCSSLSLVQLHGDLPKMKPTSFRGCPLQSFRPVPLSDRMEAIRMDDETKSMFESRLREITLALTGEDRDEEDEVEANDEEEDDDVGDEEEEVEVDALGGDDDGVADEAFWGEDDDEEENDSDDERDAEAVREKCKECLGRAHEFLTYLELKGAAPVLELALWKIKIDGKGEERAHRAFVSNEVQGQDLSDVARERKRLKVNEDTDRDSQLSRTDCRIKCGAGIVSSEVLKFFSFSTTWPRMDGQAQTRARGIFLLTKRGRIGNPVVHFDFEGEGGG